MADRIDRERECEIERMRDRTERERVSEKEQREEIEQREERGQREREQTERSVCITGTLHTRSRRDMPQSVQVSADRFDYEEGLDLD